MRRLGRDRHDTGKGRLRWSLGFEAHGARMVQNCASYLAMRTKFLAGSLEIMSGLTVGGPTDAGCDWTVFAACAP